jgi:hypothetical protein
MPGVISSVLKCLKCPEMPKIVRDDKCLVKKRSCGERTGRLADSRMKLGVTGVLLVRDGNSASKPTPMMNERQRD